MNTEFFIARRIAFEGQKSFSKIIIRIAILTIALGLAVMISSLAIITGFNQKISEKIFGFWGHIHITDIQVSRSYEHVPIDYNLALIDSIEQIQSIRGKDEEKSFSFIMGNEIKSKGGIQHMQSFAFMPGIFKSKTELEGIMLKGVNKDFNWEILNQYLVEGDPIPWSDTLASRKLIISKRTSERLRAKVGDKIVVHFIKDRDPIKRAFTVGGIYKTGLEEYDVKFALCDIRIIQELLGWESNQVGGYEIFLEDVRDMPMYADFVYSEMLPPQLYAESIAEKFPNIFDWLELQKINERIILFLMLLVSIINMTTVILIIILERSRMIGVLKSIGWMNWNIRKIFLYFSFWIITLGIILGNVLGIGFCLLQKKFEFIKLDEVNYYVSTAPITLDPFQIIMLNIGTIFVILLFLIIPTYLVTRIQPVKVLRFD